MSLVVFLHMHLFFYFCIFLGKKLVVTLLIKLNGVRIPMRGRSLISDLTSKSRSVYYFFFLLTILDVYEVD